MSGRSYRFICLPIFVLMLLASVVSTAQAQTILDAGAFRVEFWDQADGDALFNGTQITQANLGTWNAAERAAVVRAFEYWTDVLNLAGPADDDSPLLRFAKDVSAFGGNAYATSALNTSATPGFGGDVHTKTNIYSRLLEGTTPGRIDGVDGFSGYIPGAIGGNTYNTDRITQYMPGDFALERTAIHEIGHLLGGTASTSIWNLFNDTGPNPDVFMGPNSIAVFGGTGVPTFGSHGLIDYTNFTRGTPFGVSFRNIPFFSPAELAIFTDMGYNIILSDHFASAFYQDGTGMLQNNADVFNSTKNYGVGVWIQSDDHNINQTGNLTSNGFAGAGVRVADGLDNIFTLADSAAINANGEEGIGVVASAGANTLFVIRGDVNANGTNGVGFRFDFGPSLTFSTTNQITSSNYGAPLVERLDISGNISATTNAIQISDTAGIGSINIMNGASISGDIVSDARIDAGNGLTRPEITFGFEADMNGQVTGTADNAFDFTFDDDIVGSTTFNATFAGGTTNLNGMSNFNDADVLAGATLTTTGMINTATFDLLGGANFINNGSLNTNSMTTGINSRIEGNGLFTSSSSITLNGTTAPGNSIGTTIFNTDVIFSPSSVEEIEIQPAANPIPGTDNDLIQVNGTVTFNGGTVDVQGMPPGGAYTMGATYTWLQSTDGIGVNTAPILTEDLLNFRLIPFFTFNSAGFMLANDAPYLNSAVNYNERMTAAYLDVVKLNLGNPQIQTLRDQLDLLPSTAAVRNALNQLSGEIYGTSAIYQIQSMNHLMGMLMNQLGHNHAEHIPCMNEIWYSGYASDGHVGHDGNASSTDYDSVGHIVGKSWCISDRTIMGAFFNTENQTIQSTDVMSRVENEAQRFGLYFRDERGIVHTSLTGFAGWNNFDSSRTVRVNNLAGQNRADYDGWTTGFLYENGVTIGNEYLHAQPFASIQYFHADSGNFTEKGGPITSLRVGDIETSSFRSKLGGRYKFFNFRKLLSLDVESAWTHEFADTSADYQAGLTSAPGSFDARGADLGDDWLTFGPSINFMTGPLRTFVEYQAAFGEASIHSGQWGTELIW